jgi:hypothetical protein
LVAVPNDSHAAASTIRRAADSATGATKGATPVIMGSLLRWRLIILV